MEGEYIILLMVKEMENINHIILMDNLFFNNFVIKK